MDATRHLNVLQGRDREAIEIAIEVHCENIDDPVILDCTHNQGTMWKGCRYAPTVRSDIDPAYLIDVVADFGALPFRDDTFDIIVFDPPHLPVAAASEHSSGIWMKRYGITAEGAGRDGDNVSGMFVPFLIEAKRVLKAGGIVLAKIADLTHNHKYQWQMVDLIIAVRQVGLTACDMLIKMDPSQGNLKSSKWKTVKHFRKANCFWVIIRNDRRCERRRE